MAIPELEHHSGSWIVTCRSNGAVIGEFFNRTTVERINTEKYLVETAATYLGRLGRA